MKTKKQIYPKTKRIASKNKTEITEITEKMDGSNIGIFKLENKLIVATRNFVYDGEDINNIDIRGLAGWFKKNEKELTEEIRENSGFFGEFLNLGQIKYDFENRLFIFAKAKINKDFEISNIYYEQDLLRYCFLKGEIPKNISLVPLVEKTENTVDKEYLDKLYNEYSQKENRKVEGFIVNKKNNILKYVRFKNGKEKEHKE